MIQSAVDIECEFITKSLPVALIGMNANEMIQYIKFCADFLLENLGIDKLYHVKNPFNWMELISLQGKSNMFERRIGEYSLAGVGGTVEDVNTFSLEEDF
jgi:ribonucleoside-diphosphate reductase beta chain